MHKKIYTISTPYGNQYQLNKDGYVLQYSNGLDKRKAPIADLQTWQVLGIVELKPFGNIGRLIPLHEAVKIKDLAFKNGAPKYTIIDLDHGTRRLVGNTRYHGVRAIYQHKE